MYRLLLILLLTLSAHSEENCSCTMDNNTFGTVEAPALADGAIVTVSSEDHMVDGTNIGKLFSVNGKIYTQNNYTVKQSTTTLAFSDGDCPKGYRKLTLADLQNIADKVTETNIAQATAADKMNFVVGEEFYTTERTIPEGSGLDSYKFKAIKLKDSDTAMAIIEKTTAMTGTTKRTKCVMVSTTSAEDVKLEEDLVAGLEYSVDITMTNVLDYEVDFGAGKKEIGTKTFKYVVDKAGCSVLKKKWKLFDGTIHTQCDSRFVRPYKGSEHDTTLAKEDIQEVVYDGVAASRINSLHFAAASAPMAAKDDGGAYILYKVKDTNALMVLEVDNDMVKVKDYDLGTAGTPLAIAAGSFGFVVYLQNAEDKNHSWLSLYSKEGSKKWSKVIMNNGADPKAIVEQIDFFDKDKKRFFGMNAMYKPHNGQFVLGRGRIFLTFAHYNNFKIDEGGLDGHTGDTMISFDYDGKGWMLGSAWSASHSLVQRAVYDGKMFYTSALGDAYPQQIKFTWNDAKYSNDSVDGVSGLKNRFDNSGAADIISGEIPGNGGGKSCGRLGGLSIVDSLSYQFFAQVYARRACTSGYSGSNKTNTVNEIGLVTFDRLLKAKNQYKLADGKDVNAIISGKYGKNIFILYNRSSSVKADDTFNPASLSDDDKAYVMLVSPTGTVKTSETQLEKNIMTNDTIIELSDANLAWSKVDADGKLYTYRLKVPTSTKPTPSADAIQVGSVGATETANTDGSGDTKSVSIFKSVTMWSLFIGCAVLLMKY